MKKKNKNELLSYHVWYEKWKQTDTDKNHGSNIFIKSVMGVFYPKGILDDEIYEQTFRTLTDKNDDVWMTAMCLISGVSRRKILTMPKYMKPIIGTDKTALSHINVNYNDIQIKRTFDYYDLYEKLED
jgi:hypothetical protein